VDAGETHPGHPSQTGCLYHTQDAADILQIQPFSSLCSLCLRQRSTYQIPKGSHKKRYQPGHHCGDPVIRKPDKFPSSPPLSGHRGGGTDKKGQFHRVPHFKDPLLCRFFTLKVFSLLLEKKLINQNLVQKISQWRHTGFNVHSKVRAESKGDLEKVGKYMIRPILSLKRLSLDKALGQVVYQYGKHSSETESMDYLEFIARVTSHIPDKGQVMVRYYGLYANAHRGKMRKKDTGPLRPLIIEDEDPFIPSKGWAEMIKKVYEIDPLICPKCGGIMRIVSFIEDHKVIDKIIKHLNLTFKAVRPPPPQAQLSMAAEELSEYI